MKTKLAFKEESYRNLQVRVGPRWSKEDAQRANQVQQTWNEFFYKPALLIKANLLKSESHLSFHCKI